MQRRSVADIPQAFEQYLRSLSDDDWSALAGRVRSAPTDGPSVALRTAVAKHVSGDQLEAVMRVVNPAAFVDDSGNVDEAKVGQHLGTLFGTVAPPGPSHQNFGQSYPPRPIPGPGEHGRAEATKRFGAAEDQPKPTRGRAGYDEAARRFPKKGER
jgi:hypothetical protein